MPGWTGLANARVTIFGDVYALPKELQEGAQDVSYKALPFATLAPKSRVWVPKLSSED